MTSHKDKNIESMPEAEKGPASGATSTSCSTAKEHAHEALQQAKDTAVGKEHQITSGMEKHSEPAKELGKETGSGISGAFSSLGEKMKNLVSSSTTATIECTQHAKDQAEQAAHEASDRIKDAAEKGKHKMEEAVTAAKAEKESLQSRVAHCVDTMKGQSEEAAHRAKEATGSGK